MSKLSPEQIAQQQAEKAEAAAKLKAEKEAKKAADNEAKKQEAEAKKAQRLADNEAKKQAKKQEAEAKKAERLAKQEAKKQEAEAKKADKEANRMPEQNGIRRPKPNTLCGKAWGIADDLSAKLGQPVPIANLLEATNAAGLNEGNVKAEYARWRKFHGVTGRVTLPKPETQGQASAA